MTDAQDIDRYILGQLTLELDEWERSDIDPGLRHFCQKLREFYWTVTRLVGLGYLHDGSWRKPAADEAPALRPLLEGNIPAPPARARILIDVTATHRYDINTGVQRVIRGIARAAVESGAGLPVYIEAGRLYSHFRHPALPDDVTLAPGDKLLLLDASWNLAAEYESVLAEAARLGVERIACLYDLIPLRHPAVVGHVNRGSFARWFETVIATSDAVVGISRCVIDDFVDYAKTHPLALRPTLRLGWWPLGADLSRPAAAAPSDAAPSDAARRLIDAGRPLFLSVGTMEPRKGLAIALDAFDALWRDGRDATWAIVGRPGWNIKAFQQRLRSHPEFGRRLFWLIGASDADLQFLYSNCRALVFPSVAEGFGLPIVEAAHFGAPVIASDIPVFREVGGDGVIYFKAADPAALKERLGEALDAAPPPLKIHVTNWSESAATLLSMIGAGTYQTKIDAVACGPDALRHGN